MIELIAGSQLVVGGNDGFILSDSSDRQVIGIDSTFSKEFELNNENGWTKVFPKSISGQGANNPQEQFENEHQLPAIEVSTLDDTGNTANTYIYTYYFEEVECVPDSFYAVFTDSNGNLIGDAENQFYSDETITATNRPVGFNILKVDLNDVDKKLAGAEFQLRKLSGDPPAVATGGTFGTDNSITFPPTETAFRTGIARFAGLTPGYYEVRETNPPSGYILVEPLVIYLKVKDLGEISFLNKVVDPTTGVVTFEEVPDGEWIGNVLFTSSTTTNGKEINFTVKNVPGAELPASGGPGTRLIYMLGAMLVMLGGEVLLFRTRMNE